MMPNNIKWCDGLQHRGRTPSLFLCKEGVWVKFAGKPISGQLAILSSKDEKNGKWSNTSYDLAISASAVAVELLRPWDGWGSTMVDIAQGFRILCGEGMDSAQALQGLLTAKLVGQDPSTPLGSALARAMANSEALAGLD